MPIRFKCPTCERMLSIARRKAGTRVACPRCEDDVTVPDADLADEDEVNVEPVEVPSGSDTKPIAIGTPPKPKATPRAKPDKLFEQANFEQLLDEKVAKATEAVKEEPPQLAPPAAAAMPAEPGLLLSRSAAVVLGGLLIVLLGLAFATGYLIGR